MTDWREFEELAAEIYRELAPEAQIVHNDSIMGIESRQPRQIDVSVRFDIAGHQILMIVQARDYSDPVDINGVGEFASVVKDVRANRGVLVARSGFTSGAKNLANNLGIDLCNIHDAQSRKWKLDLSLPIIWVDLLPKVRLNVMAQFEAGDSIPDDSTKWVLSTDQGKTRLTILDTFANEWNEGRLSRDVGPTHHVVPAGLSGITALAMDRNGQPVWRPVASFELLYTVTRRAWHGSFTPEQCRGIFNYQTEEFHVRYLPIGSIPVERDDTWVEVNNYEELVVSIPGLLVTTERWEVDLSGLESTHTDIEYLGPAT